MVIPSGFSLINEVLNVLKEQGESMHTKDIVGSLTERFSDYGIDRKKVAAALVYLKNTRKEIESVGRGVYKAKGQAEENRSNVAFVVKQDDQDQDTG